MNSFLAVFIGGGLGSSARFFFSRFIHHYYSGGFPFGILTVNVLSCFILGLLSGQARSISGNSILSQLLITGFCGGFSTFSAFTYDSLEMIRLGNYGMAALNILGSLVLCLLSLIAGFFFSTKF